MTRIRPSVHRFTCLLLLLLFMGVGHASTTAPNNAPIGPGPTWPRVPPIASYQISVTLDPQTHTLTGHETITFHNRSDDPLPHLVFHLYLNAFSGPDTTFMRESGQAHRGFGYDPDHPGWTEVNALALQQHTGQALDGPVDLLSASTIHETLMTTTLPQPLLPGEVLTLTLDFSALLPQVFARTGFYDDFHMVGQWFPKLSVYREGRGWNAYQFHANSEFFADVGTYDVAITVPSTYVVGATGLPTSQETHPDGSVTHHYHAEAVIDFVWTAWPRFREIRRQVGSTEVVLLYVPEHENVAERYLDTAEQALIAFGDWFGPYPYPRLTLVDVPDDASGAGGMEYPTLVTVGFMPVPVPSYGKTLFPELVTAHEIAHQWWQSTVASNEFEDPWLDEGFAEYSGIRLLERVYGETPLAQLGPFSIGALELDRMEYTIVDPAVPMYGRAWDFGQIEYGVAAYAKPAMVLTTLERVLGEERWLTLLRTYYQRYRFGHPTTEDWLAVVAEVAGEETRSYLEPLVYGDGLVDYAVTRLECPEAGQTHRCEVTVSRLGDVALPVEVEISFADGSRLREQWDGRDTQQHYVYSGRYPVTSAEVDPDRRLYIDVSFYNNSLTRPVQIGPMVRISSQWFYFLQQLIWILGGFW